MVMYYFSGESWRTISGASIALDETQGVLDVGHDPAVEILTVQDVYLVSAPCQQAGDVGLRKEAAHVPGEEERSRVSEEQCAIRSFGRLDVDQHVLDLRPAGLLNSSASGNADAAVSNTDSDHDGGVEIVKQSSATII